MTKGRNIVVGGVRISTPAHLAGYVDVLGVDGASELFLALGGSQVYFSKSSSDRSLAAQIIGAEKVERLAVKFDLGYTKVPLARQWVAQVMRAQDKSDNEIARVVRADVATVRRWLGPRNQGHQLDLPGLG